jgi:hypothetical protein
MEKIRLTDRVRNEVLHGVKEERNVVKLHKNVVFFYFFLHQRNST